MRQGRVCEFRGWHGLSWEGIRDGVGVLDSRVEWLAESATPGVSPHRSG